jgi:hypothetical protein
MSVQTLQEIERRKQMKTVVKQQSHTS